MVKSLNSARESLFETALTNLETLNEKLEQAVTVIPDAPAVPAKDSHFNASSPSSELDPSELFLCSAATQTTPSLSRSESLSTTETPGSTSLLYEQHTQLQSLHTQLSDLLASNTAQIDSSAAVKSRVTEFEHHLDQLAYGSFMSLNNSSAASTTEDAISKVKAEIRGVKGQLLSARSFPGGVGARGWV